MSLIHPTAIIHPEAKLHSTVKVGPWSHIGPHVEIGAGTEVMSHVVVDGWTRIGENNKIFPFAALGHIPQDLKYNGEKTELIIGNNNTIREYVTLHLGTVQGGGVTQVGDYNLIMAYVHMGHDCIMHNHCILANGVNLAGHVVVESYANIAGMSGVQQFVTIGEHSYITAISAIHKDIIPYAVAHGQRPCALRGANIVGLRRRDFPADTIQKINESIKLWVRADVPKEQCLLEIESQYGEFKEVQKVLQFIRNSKIGVVR